MLETQMLNFQLRILFMCISIVFFLKKDMQIMI